MLTEGGLAHLGPLPPTEVLNQWRREAWAGTWTDPATPPPEAGEQ